ncbi:MAG: SUMF1/EgtB/PvdO family nonheme iron enzyme [Planctomyces sp.]|nr:SUMF1/EgtB/PvdO family nonheme iron enzyme [Planctomyces sp.]
MNGDGNPEKRNGEVREGSERSPFASTKPDQNIAKPTGSDTVNSAGRRADTESAFSARMFGRYKLLRPLGEGAMGSVFLALDTVLDRRVALKTPKVRAGERHDFLVRFNREAKAAAGLSHPHICRVYDSGEVDGVPFITMDFIDAVPLSSLIGTARLQDVNTVLRIAQVIADAVRHAHSNGIIHRDLKPGNILIDDQQNPYVTDFGLARIVSSEDQTKVTQEGILLGTPAYMAPEQVRGQQELVGVCSDVYSFGALLYEMLTGRPPFEGTFAEIIARVLRDNPVEPTRLRTDLNEEVNDVVLKLLKKKPEHRYQDMNEVLTAINRLIDVLKKRTVSKPASEERGDNPFEIQRAHIEVMLRKGQYITAIRDLEKLAVQTSPAAKRAAAWARSRLPEVRSEAKALSPAGLAALLQTAQQLFQAHDYQGCIQILEEVPVLHRTEAMTTLHRKAQDREAEAEQLLDELREKERREDGEGLEPIVRRLLKLKPGNSYAKRLLQALQSYSKLPTSRRTYRFQAGRLQPMPEPSLLRQWGVLCLLTGVLVFLAVYSYVIIYLRSGNQSLAVHIDDEWLKQQGGQLTLMVDGNEHTITASTENGESLSLVVTLGEHEFAVKHGDAYVHNPQDFEIRKDGRLILQINRDDMRLISTPERNVSGGAGSGSSSPDGSSGSQNDIAGRSQLPADGAPGEVRKTAAEAEKWIDLFNGQKATLWSTTGPYQVRNGEFVAAAKGYAISENQYSDFELEAEWRIGKDANGGIYYRERAETTSLGNEYQIADPTGPGISSGTSRSGAFYGVAEPVKNTERRLGDWNTTRIECRGSRVEHWLNGEMVVSYDGDSSDWKQKVNSSPGNRDKSHLGTTRSGHILLQNLTGEIAFRKIRIRPFSGSSSANNSKLAEDSKQEPEKLSKTELRFGNFNLLHSATAAEVVEWSRGLSPGFGPVHISLRANDNDATFDAVAIQNEYFRKHESKLAIFGENEDPLGALFQSHRPMFQIYYREGNTIRKLCGGIKDGRLWSSHAASDSQIESKIVEGMKGWSDIPQCIDSIHWRSRGQFVLFRVPDKQYSKAGWIPATTETEFGSRLRAEIKEQLQPRVVQVMNDHGPKVRLYSSLVDNPADRKWAVSTGISASVLPTLLGHVAQLGGRPYSIASVRDQSEIRFAIAWEDVSPSDLQNFRGTNIDEKDLARLSLSVGYESESTTASDGTPQIATAPFSPAKALQYQRAWAEHLKVPVEYTNSVGMRFRLIPPGTFTIGSTPEQIAAAKPHLYTEVDAGRPERAESESPQQSIRISRPFFLGTTEVTQEQFNTVVGNNPSNFPSTGDDDRSQTPVERVSWVDTGEFCERLSRHEGIASAYQITPEMISLTGSGGYRLPTEAEWEYACRAGSTTLYWCGDDEESLLKSAWYGGNCSDNRPKPVAQLAPNPFGLYDIHGNVWEWVHDSWRPNTYQLMIGPGGVDPRCDLGVDDLKVIRGGDYFMSAAEQRSACRDAYSMGSFWNDLGFRVAISVDAVRQRLVKTNTVQQ